MLRSAALKSVRGTGIRTEGVEKPQTPEKRLRGGYAVQTDGTSLL